jgi:hypothetical protein
MIFSPLPALAAVARVGSSLAHYGASSLLGLREFASIVAVHIEAVRLQKAPDLTIRRKMKINSKMRWHMALSIVLGLGSIAAAQDTHQYYLSWNAVGYTYNAKGQSVVTNENAETFIKKVANDNGLNPADLAFVYRVENLDTVVVFKSNGQFVADIYQMETTFTDITNLANTVSYVQSMLTTEIDTEGDLGNIGGIFGIQEHIYDKNGDLVGFSYHGSFNYTPLGENAAFTGTFSTGARVNFVSSDETKPGAGPVKKAAPTAQTSQTGQNTQATKPPE